MSRGRPEPSEPARPRGSGAPEVRPAELGDAAAISELAIRSWREGFRGVVPEEIDPGRAWRVDRIEDRLAGELRDGSEILVEEVAGAVRGFCLFGPCRDEDAPELAGEVWALYVDPHHWRHGVGGRLVEAAEDRLRAAGFTEARVWTLAASPRNLGFYEALGFERDGATQLRESFGSPLEVRLRRTLGDR